MNALIPVYEFAASAACAYGVGKGAAFLVDKFAPIKNPELKHSFMDLGIGAAETIYSYALETQLPFATTSMKVGTAVMSTILGTATGGDKISSDNLISVENQERLMQASLVVGGLATGGTYLAFGPTCATLVGFIVPRLLLPAVASFFPREDRA